MSDLVHWEHFSETEILYYADFILYLFFSAWYNIRKEQSQVYENAASARADTASDIWRRERKGYAFIPQIIDLSDPCP